MPVQGEGDFELGSHAVDARDQDGVTGKALDGEESAEGSDFFQHARVESLARQEFDGRFGFGGRVNVNTSITIEHGSLVICDL
jgi:hypothetical protein